MKKKHIHILIQAPYDDFPEYTIREWIDLLYSWNERNYDIYLDADNRMAVMAR